MQQKLPRNPINGWIVASVPSPYENSKYQGWTPCRRWCERNCKDENWRFVGEGVFEFRRANDHLMFVLRWS